MKELATLLESLAAELGVTVEYLWPFLVNQTVVIWWSHALTTVILGVILVGQGFLAKRLIKAYNDADWDADENWFASLVVGNFIVMGVFAIISIAIGLHCLTNLDWLLVPEAATMQRLLGML